MSKWSAIHSNVSVSAGDGFQWVCVPYVSWVPEGAANPFVEMLYPGANMSPQSAMRTYLCKTMTNTFCLGTERTDHGRMIFIVGAKEEKDIFQLRLRFADSTETKIRRKNTRFYVRVIEGDTFSENGDSNNTTYEAIQ